MQVLDDRTRAAFEAAHKDEADPAVRRALRGMLGNDDAARKSRAAFKAALKEETDPAVRRWARGMLHGDGPIPTAAEAAEAKLNPLKVNPLNQLVFTQDENTRAAFRAVAKQETDPAVRRWLLFMAREDAPPAAAKPARTPKKRKPGK